MALSDYILDTSALLHDYSLTFTPKAQVIRFINEARRQCAQRTACVQRLVTGQSAFGASAQPGVAVPGGVQPGALPSSFPAGTVTGAASNSLQTIPGQERYPFQGFFNPYLQQSYAGCNAIIDAASLFVNWGGAVRPGIAYLPWELFQAYCRAYATLVTSYPYYWSVHDPGEFGEVWMFPAPSTTGDIELEAICIPSDLNSNDDFDAIPPGLRNSIKFLAASLCFMTTYRYQEAMMMEQEFAGRTGTGVIARDRGKVAQFYQGSFS